MVLYDILVDLTVYSLINDYRKSIIALMLVTCLLFLS